MHMLNGEQVEAMGRLTIVGVRYEWFAVRRWGKRYYTFDGGDTWAPTKRGAWLAMTRLAATLKAV